MNKLPRLNLRTLVGARAGLVGGLWIAASVALGGCASQPHGAPALPPAPAPAPTMSSSAAACPALTAPLTLTQSATFTDPKVAALRGERSMDTGFVLKPKGSRKMVLPEGSGEADLMPQRRTFPALMDDASGDRGDGSRGGSPGRDNALGAL
ncbi:MAG TPA: hypothetical protein VE093_04925 [Polyangiaceae bacterium]|nr:hypothetical protein [Polyangiaceae bacterium]